MGTHKLEREKKSPFYFYRSKKKTFLIFMNQPLKIGIFGKNKNEIIGYHTAEQTCDGLAIVGDQIEVNLEISINGLKFEAKTNIALNIFQVLKTGISTGTVQLAKLNNTDVDSAYGSPAPSPAEPIKPIIEPKRKSAFNTRLGTTGKRKFGKRQSDKTDEKLQTLCPRKNVTNRKKLMKNLKLFILTFLLRILLKNIKRSKNQKITKIWNLMKC